MMAKKAKELPPGIERDAARMAPSHTTFAFVVAD